MKKDISKMNYTQAGVSIKKGNEVAERIKKNFRKKGINAEGLFGGAIDISHLKGQDYIPIGVVSSSIVEDKDPFKAGEKTIFAALEKIQEGVTPIAVLDYIATLGMDVNEIPVFAEGVATAGLEKNIMPIGGESAQMPGTYNEGRRDAYVHVITHGDQGKTTNIADLIRDMEKPLLCASTDGTGTKTRIVKDPRDIIYHGGNDLGAMGVKPIAFAVYVAGNAPQSVLDEVVAKSQKICDTLGIANLDVTVEYKPEEYVVGQVDIAGTVIGVIDEENMIKGKNVKEGDVIIGWATDCLMTNGYSLARKYVEMIGDSYTESLQELKGSTINNELSKPHVPYTDILFGNEEAEGILSKFRNQIKATAHITGGGQKDNIEKMVPEGLCASVQKEVLPLPPIVQYFKDQEADMDAMYEALNMGVGFTITVSKDICEEVIKYVNDNFRHSIEGIDRQAAQIGVIKKGTSKFEFYEK